MKKITLATVKSFIKKNEGKLFINTKSSFSGMTDCVESLNGGFIPAEKGEHPDYTLGIKGAWFVGSSRDYFTNYSDGMFSGIEVYNSCGRFIIACKN